MNDPNIPLILLQSCSLTVSALLALILLVTRIHQPQTSASYETSRWLLFASMLIFAVHYFLQMRFGFRARSEDLGVLVNLIFYTPISYMVTYATLRLVSNRHHKKVYLLVCLCSIALIALLLSVCYFINGNLHMPLALRVVAAIRFGSILTLIIYSAKEIRRVTRSVENETGGDIRQFMIYMRTGTALLYIIGLVMPFSIFKNKALFVMGPVFFFILCFYILSFVALGFNITQVADIIDEESEINNPVSEETQAAAELSPSLPHSRCEAISEAIELWRKQRGFSNPETNCTNLAVKLGIPKRQLISYLNQKEGKTFRVWLSELRIEEAKRILLESDNFKLEAVAVACGFSHRNYLQNRFKAITGLTPREWQEAHKS